jgi:hypothetical protein
MRETRQSGSEGGEGDLPDPYTRMSQPQRGLVLYPLPFESDVRAVPSTSCRRRSASTTFLRAVSGKAVDGGPVPAMTTGAMIAHARLTLVNRISPFSIPVRFAL